MNYTTWLDQLTRDDFHSDEAYEDYLYGLEGGHETWEKAMRRKYPVQPKDCDLPIIRRI